MIRARTHYMYLYMQCYSIDEEHNFFSARTTYLWLLYYGIDETLNNTEDNHTKVLYSDYIKAVIDRIKELSLCAIIP